MDKLGRENGGAAGAGAASGPPGEHAGGLAVPRRLGPSGGAAPTSGLLNDAWAAAICGWLPPEDRTDWQLLFSSTLHGKSFATFMARVGSCTSLLTVVACPKHSSLWQRRAGGRGERGAVEEIIS